MATILLYESYYEYCGIQTKYLSHVSFPPLFERFLTVTGTAGRGATPGAAATPVAEAAAD